MHVGLVAALAAAGRVSVLEREATYAFPGGRTATVAAATLADWRARPRRSGCVASRVGDAHGELGNTDEVFVEHCGAPGATNGTAVAVCVPTVYGDYLATPRGLRWTSAFLDHYRALGAARVVLYAAAPPAPPPALGGDVELVHVAWLRSCAARTTRTPGRRHGARCQFAENRSIMYWGQNFVLNDCLLRSAAAGAGWVLSVDLDELLALPEGGSLREFAAAAAAARLDVVTFGSALEAPVPCTDAAAAPCAAWAPFCDARRCADCARCPRNHGRRKHLARAGRVGRANVHFVPGGACAGAPCASRDAPTAEARLRHFSRPSRATAIFDGAADLCPRRLACFP